MSQNKDSKLFINRELSWLEFNRRVLDCSRAKHVPLGEQLNFAAIYGSNLDEFFMIRVGSLYDQVLLAGPNKEAKAQAAIKQLEDISAKVAEQQKQCDKNVEKLHMRIERRGIKKISLDGSEKLRMGFWKKYFERELLPVLSPQVVDYRHPFPFLRNMEIYVGAIIRERKNGEPVFGLIPVSAQFERVIKVMDKQEGATAFALVEELMLQFCEIAFGQEEVLAKCLFRVTRNADINVEEGMFDYDIDYRDVMSRLLKKRRKLAPVRLQFYRQAPQQIVDYLTEKLQLQSPQCMVQKAPLDLSYLRPIIKLLEQKDNPKFFYAPARPVITPENEDLLQEVQRRDVLFCYPYQSMRPFIRMLDKLAHDPDVVSIKMTLYRVASDSKVIEALIAAAENGKEVVTVVELRARFDEQNNIDWSRRLEQAGCTVIYGFTDYKVHSKLTLITRRNGAGFSYISQIGTGNYNEKTSELYTDLSYVTSNHEIGEEVASVFNNLAMERLTQSVNQLIVAPLQFKSVLIKEIREEMRHLLNGGEARVIIKCNSLSDKQMIEALSEASAAGVQVDMIVRGICCLQAGLPKLSKNIRVISIVGRYLEHSRIFAFGAGERQRVYIASGDFLTRNTERRVEVGVRIDDENIRQTLRDILEIQLADTLNARRMQPDGQYHWIEPQDGISALDSQMAMYTYLQNRLPRLAAFTSEDGPPQLVDESRTEMVLPPVSKSRRLLRRVWLMFDRYRS